MNEMVKTLKPGPGETGTIGQIEEQFTALTGDFLRFDLFRDALPPHFHIAGARFPPNPAGLLRIGYGVKR